MRLAHGFSATSCLIALAALIASFGAGIARAQQITETGHQGGIHVYYAGQVYNVAVGDSHVTAIPAPFTYNDIQLPSGAKASDMHGVVGAGLVISDKTNSVVYVISPDGATIATMSVPGLNAMSQGTMAVGTDGKLVVSVAGGGLLQYTPSQLVNSGKFLPMPLAGPASIIPTPAGAAGPPNALNFAAGADGNVWFTETLPTDAQGNLIVSGHEKIGRLAPDGTITEFAVPTQFPGTGSTDITTGTYITPGPDGNIWFVERIAGKVARITPTGGITEFKLPTSATIYGIAAGPDGNIWVKDYAGQIHRVTPTGTVTSYVIPTRSSGRDVELVLGPDGALWFMEDQAVGRISMAGAITEYPLPTPTVNGTPNYPYQLVFAPDGTGVFTEYSSYYLAFLILPGSSSPVTSAVEFYDPVSEDYFVTTLPTEIALLSSNNPAFANWSATGKSFNVWVAATAPAGSVATCRFFNTQYLPKSSHFYAAHGFGCEATMAAFPDWTLEDTASFNSMIPDQQYGTCPAGTVPVYRLYHRGANGVFTHRFVTSLAVRQSMLDQGFVAEGAGIGVGLCVPP